MNKLIKQISECVENKEVMTSKERVVKTLTFANPDRVPVDFWTLPATRLKYGEAFDCLKEESALDILTAPCQVFRADVDADPRHFQVGAFTDAWGSGWQGLYEGILGEVKHPALDDISLIHSYKTPKHLLPQHESELNDIQNFVRRYPDKFIVGGCINLFERMQFVRGTVNTYIDIIEENDGFYLLRDMLEDYFTHYLEMMLKTDVDAIVFADDWGSQRSLLISPDSWSKLFKPVYKKFFDMTKATEKFVFMHSDGYILDLYEEFIELGVDAINSQVWCMGIDKVAEKCRERITLWGEIDRQHVLPNGNVADVENLIRQMKEKVWVPGGLIGQAAPGPECSFENIRACLQSWNNSNT